MKLLFRPLRASLASRLQPILVARQSYATHTQQKSNSTASRRRAVTPFNDTGFVPWNELSAAEKASRATQQTFNFGLAIVGVVLTGGVGYFLYQDVFSPESKTAYFSRAVDRIKKDPDCVALLGDGKKIIAHGDETMNKWRRARPIASTLTTDARGDQHLKMHFYVEGPRNNGSVHVHLTKRPGYEEFEYKYFFVDVKGHSRIYLENSDTQSSVQGRKKVKLFGISFN
ncbi:import inner membrane translocase subunit tim-21, mitochondrial [Hypoxylon sp. FL1284]|nr:import inner membrane translocase subunit tim-21, mitochondrial [Hypoxylon sp. FL1284]